MQRQPNFRVVFSKSLVAASLWDYGEDEHADRALAMTDADVTNLQSIATWFEDSSYPLPMSGQRITGNHVIAFAAIMFFEGSLRPLHQTRRRAEKNRPVRFTPYPPDPGTDL